MKFQFKDYNIALSALASAGFYAVSNGAGTKKQKVVPMRTTELREKGFDRIGYLDSLVFLDETNILKRTWTDYSLEERSGIGHLTLEGEVSISQPSVLPGRRARTYRKNAKTFLRNKLTLLQYYEPSNNIDCSLTLE